MEFTAEFKARFFARAVAHPSGCVLWTGTLDRKGYGTISFNGKMLKAHRVGFYLQHGRWPEPCALHGCDTPSCVLVDASHVHEGTPAENSAEMVQRQRASRSPRARGEANGRSKIDSDAAREIRALGRLGLTHSALAARFGISKSQAGNIVNGRHWGWL